MAPVIPASSEPNVIKFVAAKASKILKDQQDFGCRPQSIPSKSFKNHEFQSISIIAVNWFGARGVGGSNPLSPTHKSSDIVQLQNH